MPPTVIETTPLPESGVAFIQVDFTDEAGAAVVPNVGTIEWTLSTKPILRSTAPTIVNSREQVAITSASTIYIPLEGADLAILVGEEGEAFVERVLTVEYQYNSARGSNLDDKVQYIFTIENLYYPT